MRRQVTTLLCVLAWPGTQLFGVDGVPSCRPQETLEQCLNRVHAEALQANRAGDDPRTEAVESAAATLSDTITAETADKAASSTGLGGAESLRDSLAGFLAGLGLGEISKGAEEGALVFRINPDLLRLGDANKLSIDALVRQAEIFSPLVEAFREADRATEKATLEGMLQDFDDVQIDLAWSLENDRFGRRFFANRRMLADLYTELLGTVEEEVPLQIDAQGLADLLTSPEFQGLNLEQAQFQDLPPRLAAELEARAVALALGVAEWVRVEDALATTTGFDLFPDLLNNQPQLSVSAHYRSRDDLVGPDLWGIEGSWELGWANLNGLRRFAREQRGDGAKPSPADIRSFVGTRVSSGTLKYAPRLAVELKYHEADPYAISLDGGAVAVDLDGTTSWLGSVAAGSYLRISDDGTQIARWDLEAEYEDVSDDPNRDDRLVATLTLTQTLADGTDAHVSFVWASKPHYLGEVDEELSARVGVKYGIDRVEQ